MRTDLRDPRIGGIVTVTHVDVSPDLRHAIAFVSVLGTDDERTSTHDGAGARAAVRAAGAVAAA